MSKKKKIVQFSIFFSQFPSKKMTPSHNRFKAMKTRKYKFQLYFLCALINFIAIVKYLECLDMPASQPQLHEREKKSQFHSNCSLPSIEQISSTLSTLLLNDLSCSIKHWGNRRRRRELCQRIIRDEKKEEKVRKMFSFTFFFAPRKGKDKKRISSHEKVASEMGSAVLFILKFYARGSLCLLSPSTAACHKYDLSFLNII